MRFRRGTGGWSDLRPNKTANRITAAINGRMTQTLPRFAKPGFSIAFAGGGS